MANSLVRCGATRWGAALVVTLGWTWQIGLSQISGVGGVGPKQPAAQPVSQAAHARSVHYTKRRTFHLPVKFDPRSRMRIRQVHLFGKTAQSDWTRIESGSSATNKFTYTAMKDDAYWFCVTTVDDQGRTMQPSIAKSLKINVDTTAPRVSVQPWTSPEGHDCIRCMIQDANPNLNTLRVSFVDRANNLQPMEPHLKHPGAFLLPNPGVWTGKIHVRCSDKAKNETSVFLAVKRPEPKPETPTPVPVPTHVAQKMKGVERDEPNEKKEPENPLPILPKNDAIIPVVSKKPVETPSFPPEIEAPNLKPTTITPPKTSDHSSKNLINTTKAEIDYRIDQVGPSGVGVVDIYMTTDNGRTWKFLHKDTDLRTPAQIHLPGEGVFGIRVVITNGNGFGGTPPRPGDQPDFEIEVDATRPQAQLANIDPYAKGGKLEIRWTASDRNLDESPVTLYYRTSPTESWQVLARDVKNEGAYSWEFPRDKGGRFYVKMEVVDRAGNVARVETPNPVVLDLTEPRAHVVGVRPISTEPAQFQPPQH